MFGPLRERPNPDYETRISLGPRMNIFDGIGLMLNRKFALLVTSMALFYCWVMAIMSTIPALLSTKYSFNTLEVGLCYLPYTVGGFATRWVVGGMTDWNYRRHARKAGIELQKNRQSRRRSRTRRWRGRGWKSSSHWCISRVRLSWGMRGFSTSMSTSRSR